MKRDTDVLANWFEYGVYSPKRIVYIGDGEGGVDESMHEYATKGLLMLDAWKEDTITIYLNTLGGDWYHGMGMYDVINSLRSHVTIIVSGYACSMGSIILQSADHRVMMPHSVMMIHDGSDCIQADCKSVETWAKKSAATRKEMYAIYAERIRAVRPRFTLKRIEAMCAHDTVFTPGEAVAIGLADEVMS